MMMVDEGLYTGTLLGGGRLVVGLHSPATLASRWGHVTRLHQWVGREMRVITEPRWLRSRSSLLSLSPLTAKAEESEVLEEGGT
jgi:hypothetical protein